MKDKWSQTSGGSSVQHRFNETVECMLKTNHVKRDHLPRWTNNHISEVVFTVSNVIVGDEIMLQGETFTFNI